jgi:hypothetical protein
MIRAKTERRQNIRQHKTANAEHVHGDTTTTKQITRGSSSCLRPSASKATHLNMDSGADICIVFKHLQ